MLLVVLVSGRFDFAAKLRARLLGPTPNRSQRMTCAKRLLNYRFYPSDQLCLEATVDIIETTVLQLTV